ncbi:hypothetical protein GCM10010530_37410 [Kribbella aluminosa]
MPRELTVATPSVPICTLSSNPANPPVRATVTGRPAPTGADCVTVGMVGGGVLLGVPIGAVPDPDSLPHPVSTSPATAVHMATAAYLLRFLTHNGYTQGCRSLQL